LTSFGDRKKFSRPAGVSCEPRKELAIIAFIILILFMEVLLAILLPGPNMGAPVRFLLGIRRGNRISLCVGRRVRRLAFG